MNNEEDRDALWDILEEFSETGLFRDWNIPKVNLLLQDFESRILENFTLRGGA